MKIALALSLLTAAATVEPLQLSGAYTFATNDRDPATMQPVCTETWSFAADGAMEVKSGQEMVRKSFRTEYDNDGHWLVTRSISTNGAPDCMGNQASDVDPEERRVLLLPMNGGDIMVCPPPLHTRDGIPLIADCFATLRQAG